MGVARAELSWQFVQSERMAQFNEKFLGHPGSTDVITFQYSQRAEKNSLVGDVLICIDAAFTHAELYNTTPQSEVLRYVIHSILHLQGFNDHTASEQKLMKEYEDKWLSWLEEYVEIQTLFKK